MRLTLDLVIGGRRRAHRYLVRRPPFAQRWRAHGPPPRASALVPGAAAEAAAS